MATKTENKKTTGQVNSYSEKLAKFAKRGTASIAQNLGGKSITTSGGGFTIDGQKTTEFEGIILDFCNLKTYYEKEWKPGTVENPDCYALSYTADSLAPHEQCKVKMAKTCAECRLNKFGTSKMGRGKMCGDRLRLHILKESDLDSKTPEPYVLVVPPTSLKAFAHYIESLQDQELCAQVVKTTFSYTPDTKSQFLLGFELADLLEDELANAALDLAEKSEGKVLAPYTERTNDGPAPKAAERSKVTAPKTTGRSKR